MSAPLQAPAAAPRWPRRLAWLWLASGLLAAGAVALAWGQGGSQWQAVRASALALHWHTVVSVGCAVALMVLSKPRGAQQLAPWAGAVQLWVLGGLLAALVLQVGVLDRWLAARTAWGPLLGVVALWLAQLLCALRTVWALQRASAGR